MPCYIYYYIRYIQCAIQHKLDELTKSKYMGTIIYQLFKEDKANTILLAIIFLLLCSIFYKEIGLKRWQRCHYGVFLLETPEADNYIHLLSMHSSKDSHNAGISIINKVDVPASIDSESLLPPDCLTIHWTSDSGIRQSWRLNTTFDRNSLKQYKGNLFAVRLHKEGKVTLYVTSIEDKNKLNEIGVYQADLVEPEKMVAKVTKKLLHMEDMNPTTKETTDHINSLLDRAFDASLSTNRAINDELRNEIQTFLHENDTDLIEDRQEAIRIKRYCINSLLALALVSDVDERDELINRVYDYTGWKNDKELTSTYIGVKFVRLLFDMQDCSMYHIDILYEIDKYIRENKEYISPQQVEHCKELTEFCMIFYRES